MSLVQAISPTLLMQKRTSLTPGNGEMSLIDVREEVEFAEVSVSFAQNHPLSEFNPTFFSQNFAKDRPIYLLCRSGKRSFKAAQLLVEVGFKDVYNVDGGMLAWEAEGQPVVK